MNLANAKLNNWYFIKEVEGEGHNLHSRLMAFGFIPGERVMVKRVAPIFKDPLLVQIGNSQMALTVDEAMNIILDSSL